MSDSAFELEPFLRTLTHRPGVYRMLDGKHAVIYVGKARDLKKRVSSYFRKSAHDAKTTVMMSLVERVEVTVANTEAEALLLENSLIKQHRPRFNILMRDDKSYPYIYASTDHKFPRLRFHRGPRRGKGRYFGPYPGSSAVRQTLNELQKLFMIRNCSESFFRNRSRPCLQHQIRRCSAPCVGLIEPQQYTADFDGALLFLEGKNQSVIDRFVARMELASEAREYELAAQLRDQVSRLKEVQARQLVKRTANLDIDVIGFASNAAIHCVTVMFIRNGAIAGNRDHFPRLEGETDAGKLLNAFAAQYYLAAGDAPAEVILPTAIEDAEILAAELGKRAGHKVQIKSHVRGDRRRWLEMARINAEQGLNLKVAKDATIERQFVALGDALKLDAAPERIECFDVSHTSGEATVASCVVFNRAGPLKSDYRRFNLSPDSAGDDYAAMAEALSRRYARIQSGEVPLPDVLLIDGGKGQLTEALAVLEKYDLDWLRVVAVAKGRARRPGAERLFFPGEARARMLPADSAALLLIQQIRDEAHRFAITGHRQRRARTRRTSRLQDIPGIGAARRRALLQQFGGLQGVLTAGIEDLAAVPGIGYVTAETIYNSLHTDGE